MISMLSGSLVQGAALVYAASPLPYSRTTEVSALYHSYFGDRVQRVRQLVEEKSAVLGLTKSVDLKIVEEGVAESFGSTLSPCRCGIAVHLSAIPDEALPLIVAHELAHIVHNDQVTTHSMGMLAGLSASMGLSFFTDSSLWLYMASCLASSVGALGYLRHREGQADAAAIAVCSLEERRGALHWLKALQSAQMEAYRDGCAEGGWEAVKTMVQLSPAGESRLDFVHPSLESRIAAIEASCLTE